MRKLIILLFLLVFIGTVHSLEGGVGISFGVLGIGLDTYTGMSDGYYYGRVLNFMFHTNHGLGFSISPFAFFGNFKNENTFSLTFINISLEYNFLNSISESFVFGPFVSMNALRYSQPTFFEFHSGLKFSFLKALEDSKVFYNELFIVELGYKYNKTNKHGFFVTIGIDMILGLFIIGSGKMSETFPDGLP